MKPSLAAVVLAAGASRRLGQPKQLLVYRGETLLARTIRLAQEAGFAPVVAVLGYEHERMQAAIGTSGAAIVLNPHWQEGMSNSIQTGLNAVEQAEVRSDGVLILTCDQPRLSAEHLRAMRAEFAAHTEPVLVASAYVEIVGTPAIFPRTVFADLRALCGDKGARALLAAPPCPLIALSFAGGEVDIDEPEDLLGLLR